MKRVSGSAEVVACSDVLDPTRMARLPTQQLASLVVGRRVVQTGKAGEEAKVLRRLLISDALGLDPELAGDRLGDHLARNARIAHAMQGRAGRRLLQRQA